MAIAMMTATAALAQRTISGTVIEKETNEAVIQATVALLKSDSTLVANAVTNMSGQFLHPPHQCRRREARGFRYHHHQS